MGIMYPELGSDREGTLISEVLESSYPKLCGDGNRYPVL